MPAFFAKFLKYLQNFLGHISSLSKYDVVFWFMPLSYWHQNHLALLYCTKFYLILKKLLTVVCLWFSHQQSHTIVTVAGFAHQMSEQLASDHE